MLHDPGIQTLLQGPHSPAGKAGGLLSERPAPPVGSNTSDFSEKNEPSPWLKGKQVTGILSLGPRSDSNSLLYELAGDELSSAQRCEQINILISVSFLFGFL